MSNKDSQLFSIIDFLRFPLAVMIVMTHADFTVLSMGGSSYVFELQDYPIFLNVSNLISRLIVRLAVPLYFVFSGYLFFNNVPKFTKENYRNKLQRRFKSLLTPYIFWNLVVLLFFFMVQTFLPSMTSGDNVLVKDYSLTDWLMVFWTPMCGPFWYIRDLFIAVLLSPILYYLIKKGGMFFVGLLGLLWFVGLHHEPSAFSSTSFFFFSLGALFPVKEYDLLAFIRKSKIVSYALSLTYLLLMMVLYNLSVIFVLPSNLSKIIFDSGILFMMVSALNIADCLLTRKHLQTNEFLNKSSFFIYAFHSLPLLFVTKILVKVLNPLSDSEALFVYIISPIIIIAVALSLFAILKKLFPKFTAIITGYRV